jgi:DedD protein
MGLLSFLKRNRNDDAPAAKPASADEVQRARTRARQRLIGAVVLLAVGVIAFPLVFETQPRPIAVDIPIEIPRKDAVPPLPPPRAKPQVRPEVAASGAVINETAADAGRPVVAAAPSAPAVPASAPVAKVPAEPTREAAREVVKPAPVIAEAARARAVLEDKAAVKAGEAAGRFVVQVGAFAEAGAAREARLKVEKLGLKSYTQEVETGSGKRIRVRVGPFPTRDEADKAAGRIKSAGMPTAVLGL